MPRADTYLARPAHAAEIADEHGVSSRRALNVLSELVQRGEARRLAKGVYDRAVPIQRRTLRATPAMRRVARAVSKRMPALEPVISSTAQVGDLMHNTPFREVVLVEVARPFAGEVARALASEGLLAMVVAGRRDMERLAALRGRVIVAVIPVGDLRSSVAFGGARMSRPERLLVDLAVERERIGLPVYAEDIRAIGEELLSAYDFSVSRALDYARRRRAYGLIRELLSDLIEANKTLRPYAATLR